MPSRPANVVLLGLAKTGSTELYRDLKAALRGTGHDYYCLFEPTRADQLRTIHRLAPELPLLTKVMIAREPDVDLRYDVFDRRVTMVRDPRDMIVSFLLFRPFIRAGAPWRTVEPFVDALRQKEADPGSWSVQALHRLADDLGMASYRLDRVVEFMDWQEHLVERHDVFVVRRERHLAGDLGDLSDHLGVAVSRGASGAVAGDPARGPGDEGRWRDWFTPDDVTAYRSAVGRYMKRFGYDDGWELAATPAIRPDTASGYVERKHASRLAQHERRRQGLGLDPAVPGDRGRVEQLADDGNAQAMYRLARLGSGKGTDPARVARLAHRAALQGHRPAMRMLAECYRDGRGVPVDAGMAAFWSAHGRGEDPRPGGLRRLLSRR